MTLFTYDPFVDLERRLADLIVQKTVKCPSLPSAYRGLFDVLHETCVLTPPKVTHQMGRGRRQAGRDT